MNKGGTIFVDQYSDEFSRDVEPVTGPLGDNYYYQLAGNVRRYKGARLLAPISPRPIHIDGSFDDWHSVAPEFRDDVGDPVRRDSAGWGNNRYVNLTGRNDIVAAKASYDAKNVYFYGRTKDALTPHADPAWMLLFVDADANPKTGWLGYDFVINRSFSSDRAATIERNVGGRYEWERVADVDCASKGNELELCVPRSTLGLTRSSSTIDFKWADNIRQTGEISDFTLNGDAAPNDRFNYRAKLTERP